MEETGCGSKNVGRTLVWRYRRNAIEGKESQVLIVNAVRFGDDDVRKEWYVLGEHSGLITNTPKEMMKPCFFNVIVITAIYVKC